MHERTLRMKRCLRLGKSIRMHCDTLISVALPSMEGQIASDFIKNILIYVPKMNEGLTGLERHERE